MVLLTEVAVLKADMNQSDSRLQYFTNCVESMDHQINRQVDFLYHEMYRGTSDCVQVIDSQNKSINGRFGLITGYNREKMKFKVRLGTKTVMPATRFTGEAVFICPGELQTVPHCISETNRQPIPAMPLQLSAVIVSLDDKAGNHVTSITVDRLLLDTIQASMINGPVNGPINEKAMWDVVRSFIWVSSAKQDHQLLKTIQNAPVFGVRNGIHRKRKKKKKVSPTVTATKRSTTTADATDSHPIQQCRTACTDCNNHRNNQCCQRTVDSSYYEQSVTPADHFTEKSQFDMSLIANPHDILFQFPFRTENCEMISVAHELNELNITPNVQSIRSEEEMFAVSKRFGISITNADLYHMLPHERITESVINLWTQW